LSYEGERTAEEIINFINKNREPKAGASAAVEEVAQTSAVEEEVAPSSSSSASHKDELYLIKMCVSYVSFSSSATPVCVNVNVKCAIY
jgi:hypothetical protein